MADHQPEIQELLKEIDKSTVFDGELDAKMKRLVSLACVAVRMCEDCVYAQGLAAKKAGASKKEIIEVLKVAVLAGGAPAASAAKNGIARLFEEWEE